MNDVTKSMMQRLIDRVFPRMPDFYGLINEQCDLAVETMQVFMEFLQSGDEAIGQKVRDLEHRADDLKNRNIQILNASFSTPMDREDLYDAIAGIDYLVNFTKTTVYELHLYKTAPDKCMRRLTKQLTAGVVSLRNGFALLEKDPAAAEPFAVEAKKAERRMKKIYRRGMVVLLDKEKFKRKYSGEASDSEDMAIDFAVYMMKKREIYRHLSHAADRLARVSELLHDIVVKLM
jgi:uncharacterized protein Yka (UPF0111/DUF47 family)